MNRHPLTTVRGIGETTAQRLAELGIATPAELAAAPIEVIAGLPGFSVRRAAAVLEAAVLVLVGEGEEGEKDFKDCKDGETGEKTKKKKGKKKNKKKKKKKDKKKKKK